MAPVKEDEEAAVDALRRENAALRRALAAARRAPGASMEVAYEGSYRATFEQAAVGIAHVGLDGTWIRANATLCDLLGYTEAELKAHTFQALTHPDDLDRDLAAVDLLLRGEVDRYSMRKRYLHKQGRVIWAELTVSLVRDAATGEPLHFISVVEDETARHQAEEALRRSEEQRRIALEAAELGTWDFDYEAGTVYWDARARAMFGLPGDAVTTLDAVLAQIHPADRARVRAAVDDALDPATPGAYAEEYRVVHAGGAERWVQARGEAFFAGRGPDRRAVRFIGTVMDVTQRRAEEVALRMREAEAWERLAELEATYETAPVGLCVFDRELRFTRINEHLAEMNGLAVEEHLGRTLGEVLPELAQTAEPLLRRVIETGEPALDIEIEGETPARPGEHRQWVESWFPLRDASGAIVGLNVVAEEVTEQRRIEAALREREARFSALFESIDEGYCLAEMILDDEGQPVDYRFLEVNPLFEAMTGLADATGRTAYELVPNLERHWVETYAEVALGGEPLRFENGSEVMGRWFDVFATPVEPPGRFALVFRDITERRRAEQALRESEAALRRLNETLEERVRDRTQALEQRNRELQDFAYAASHDLQEPLRKISTFSSLLMADYGNALDGQGHHYLDRMQDAASRMSTLIRELLAFSRVTTQGHPFKPVDLDRIAAAVLDDLQVAVREADAEVAVEPLPTLEADPIQMHQLLQNLIGNALKYQQPGTSASVRVWAEAGVGGTCRLCVRDNGIGFDEKYLDRIFTPFQRLHGRDAYEGTGMGLAICRKIVERHGGTLTATSTPGVGSTFVATIPVGQAAHGEPPGP